MYFYSICGYDEGSVLTHEKLFTRKQLVEMAKEAPLYYGHYDIDEIEKHLKSKYGFKDLEYAVNLSINRLV